MSMFFDDRKKVIVAPKSVRLFVGCAVLPDVSRLWVRNRCRSVARASRARKRRSRTSSSARAAIARRAKHSAGAKKHASMCRFFYIHTLLQSLLLRLDIACRPAAPPSVDDRGALQARRGQRANASSHSQAFLRGRRAAHQHRELERGGWDAELQSLALAWAQCPAACTS